MIGERLGEYSPERVQNELLIDRNVKVVSTAVRM